MKTRSAVIDRVPLALLTAVCAAIVMFSSCELANEPEEPLPVYSSVKVQPEQDSIFMNATNETMQLTILGAIVNVSEKTISNTGIMTEVKYIVRTVDTLFQPVDPAKAEWFSTSPAVASVSKGLVTAKTPGYAQIYARIGNAYSKPIVVNVRAVNTAPGLSLYPPEVYLTMQNSVPVSGITQTGAVLSVTEPNSGYNNPVILLNNDGTFNLTVTGLNEGIRTITARATHPNDPLLYTERTKTVIYYAPNTPAMNSIVGNWNGETLGKPLRFAISNSIIPTRYDISGTIDIDFQSLGLGLGLVKDINLIGILNHNGSIDVAISKDVNGFKISGTLNGHFQSTGTGKGTYSAQAVRSGWPKISFNDEWSAVKVP